MELSELQEVRRQKAANLSARGIDPYPTRAERTHTSAEAIAQYEGREPQLDGADDAEPVTLVGRVVGVRHMGKTAFSHIRDGHGQLQLYLRRDELGDEEFETYLKLVDLGDFVQATGRLFRTKTGEVSL